MRVRRWPAVRRGGICGAAAALLAAAHEALASAVLPQSLAVTLLAGVVFFLVCLALFFAAGALAGRDTGLVRSGTLAGIFAALIAGATTILFAIVHTVLQQGAGNQPAGAVAVSPVRYALELAAGASGLFLAILLLFLVFGAAFGALGGVAGRPVVGGLPTDVLSTDVLSPTAMALGIAGGAPEIAGPLHAPTVEVATPADTEAAVHVGATVEGDTPTERE